MLIRLTSADGLAGRCAVIHGPGRAEATAPGEQGHGGGTECRRQDQRPRPDDGADD